MLGEKSADFNNTTRSFRDRECPFVSSNPPLTAGAQKAGGCPRRRDLFRARALLYGADPEVRGSGFKGIELETDIQSGITVASLAFEYYLERLLDGASLIPVPRVQTCFERLAQERNIDLAAIYSESERLRVLRRLRNPQAQERARTRLQQLIWPYLVSMSFQ